MKKIAMGADIGGSHISCRLFDLEANQMVDERIVRMPVDSQSSKENILDNWAKAILKAAGNIKPDNLAGIGFAMPGPFDYLKGVAWFKGVQKFDDLYGVDVRKELIKRLQLPEDFPLRFLNDATSFAVGEAFLGEVSVHKKIIALTLGTGFGSTFINNRLPVAGSEGVPDDGFLYHVPFKSSVADDYFSTRWFLKEYKNATGKEIRGVKDLSARAPQDESIKNLFARFGKNLGEFLAPWVKRFNADGIVMGGNISKSFPWFENEMQAEFSSFGVSPKVYVSTLEENAALTGSAQLCDDEFYLKLLKTNIIN